MFGGLLPVIPQLVLLPGQLEATFSEARCPSRVVEVAVTNKGTTDERYVLRVDGKVFRIEVIAAGTTVRSLIPLLEDHPTPLSVQTTTTPVASTTRTADCAPPSPPTPKGGLPPAPSSAPPAPAAKGGSPVPSAGSGLSPSAPEGGPPRTEAPAPAAKGGPPVPSASSGLSPSAPEGGSPRAAPRSEAPAPTVESGSPAATSKSEVPAPAAKGGSPEAGAGSGLSPSPTGSASPAGDGAYGAGRRTLPYTGTTAGALGFTGAATVVTGGILVWYGLLWPRRRTGLLTSGRAPES